NMNQRPKLSQWVSLMLIAMLLRLPVALPSARIATASAATDLTGLWVADDGGMYYLRQLGNTVWWAGFDPDPVTPVASKANAFHSGLASALVFQGTLAGDTITGDWAETPRQAASLRNGTVSLRLLPSSGPGGVELRRQAQTGGLIAS